MKTTKALPDIHLDEDDIHGSVERALDTIKRSMNGLISSNIVSGTIVADVVLSTAGKRVEHKLGRKPLGYIVIRKNADENIFDSAESREDLFLNLTASGPVTASLWIF